MVVTPLFQVSQHSLAYQFTIRGFDGKFNFKVPFIFPRFEFLEKFCIFNLVFGQDFSSQDANFQNFHYKDPSFFKENPLPRPYFWKSVQHTPTKKKKSWVPPPGMRLRYSKRWKKIKLAFWPRCNLLIFLMKALMAFCFYKHIEVIQTMLLYCLYDGVGYLVISS